MPASRRSTESRPSNREVENENQRPPHGTDSGKGKPPRPATEPQGAKYRGAESSSESPKTRTDPGSGESWD
jgi:hypothetical protein